MNLSIYLCSKRELTTFLESVISDAFSLDPAIVPSQIKHSLSRLIASFKDNTWMLIECPYVDKIFRDSYYLYYSSKYGRYSRDSIKVSLFAGQPDTVNFRSSEGFEILRQQYLGFFVVRPTEPDFLGRNTISPRAFKNLPSFEYCSMPGNTTANGLKFEIRGFPHSSQDGETYSCAETTLWSVMEYFSNKYAEYQPLKPSRIHAILKGLSYERQIPSRGLSIYQISYVLKESGFGCRIYSRNEYGDDFFRLLNSYVESGIPVAVGMDDFGEVNSQNIGHAVLIIGRTVPDEMDYKNLKANVGMSVKQLTFLKTNQIEFCDCNNIDKSWVFIDDNHPPYQIGKSDYPKTNYNANWSQVKFEHFVVPLYPKIYLESFEAQNFVRQFLFFGLFPLEPMQRVYMWFYLTSSRSFKHSLALSDVQDDLKSFILEKPMPKFVWIAELSNPEQMKNQMRTGLLVIDATEPNISDNKPLIVAAYQNHLLFFDGDNDVLQKMALTLQPFSLFINNLTPSEQ
ncbi:MAG: hypothetical protein M9901_07800 [Lentimicrobium sp.]|jgi:hypothetical protein|nr:hypothetical protein [Lentimicrobium sp.]